MTCCESPFCEKALHHLHPAVQHTLRTSCQVSAMAFWVALTALHSVSADSSDGALTADSPVASSWPAERPTRARTGTSRRQVVSSCIAASRTSSDASAAALLSLSSRLGVPAAGHPNRCAMADSRRSVCFQPPRGSVDSSFTASRRQRSDGSASRAMSAAGRPACEWKVQHCCGCLTLSKNATRWMIRTTKHSSPVSQHAA